MAAVQLDADSLARLSTFLARRWSDRRDARVVVSESLEARTKVADGLVVMASPKKKMGNGLQRYRQFRTLLWYESMRLKHCSKILSNDHAFGFVLNAMETKRVEGVGRQTWRGMDEEIVFGHACAFLQRPGLGAVYGNARLAEAFYQQLTFGAVKGEMQASRLERVCRAAELAEGAVAEAVMENHGTGWMEGRAREVVGTLGIDPLLTIPVSLPFMKAGMALDEEDLKRALRRAVRRGDFAVDDSDSAIAGDRVRNEYRVLAEETERNQAVGLAPEAVGVRTPGSGDADESAMYDLALIGRLKAKAREWKSGWSESHAASGEEFDEEGYVDGQMPFLIDVKRSIKTKIFILLDHSSSMSSDSLEYKKATVALCEVLAFLRVAFAVYAFSTQNREVVCWEIKQEGAKWNSTSAKRLAQIAANGSTPLAEVYDRMLPILRAKTPNTLLTLTDGEPSDADAVRAMIKILRGMGIRMVALGMGPNVIRATEIVNNLKHLGYERAVAVSRLADIPGKVMSTLHT